MKRQDPISAQTGDTQNVRHIRSVVKELFPKKIFGGITQQHNATWKPYLLVTCAFLWMSRSDNNLTDSFSFVYKMLFKIFTTLTVLGSSYQGFMNQLGRYNAQLMNVILPHLRELTKSKLQDFWLVAGFLLLGVDGSRVQLARTRSLQNAFAPKRKKKETKRQYKKRRAKYKKKQTEAARRKKAESPQFWLTLLWHVGTGLPYDWRIGPSDSSEREHAQSMFETLPEGALIVADAGFIGYDFWSSMIEANKHFVIRVGGNVTLLRKLGWETLEHKDTVYLWPKGKRDQEPLVLRLIRMHDGKHPLCLVTNLSEEKLSGESALEIYRRRWGIEVFFRTLKQTFERRKLRSTGATNAPLELEWSLVSLWGMFLFGEEAIHKVGEDVSRMSPVKVIKAFRQAIAEYRVHYDPGELGLRAMLKAALLDDYVRLREKTNPEYPRLHQKKKLHEPIIEIATNFTRKQAKCLKENGPTT